MQARRLGFESSPALDDLYYTYLAIEPQTEKEISAFQYSLQLLEAVRTNRGNRIRLSFGALTPLKGHDVFLRAAAIVAEQLPAARFLIVGGRCVARRLNIAGVPFFLVRASVRG